MNLRTSTVVSAFFCTMLIGPFSTLANAESKPAGDSTSGAEEQLTAAAVALLYKSLAEHVRKNVDGANRESGEGAKLLKALTGVSELDIKRYGICGGPNSELRKLLGNKTCGAIK